MNDHHQTRLEQDFDLLKLAHWRAHVLLMQKDTYRVKDADRILRAAKQLHLLIKDLEA
jgi:hypothetical protein